MKLGEEGSAGAASMPAAALSLQRAKATTAGDKFEQRLKMKLGEEGSAGAESESRTETIRAGDKFEQRLKMKLQERGNISTESMPSAALSRQRAPAITARDKVEQQTKMKLEEDGNIDAGSIPAALPRQRAETTTSGNTFEQRLKMKLREDGNSRPKSMPAAALPRHRAMATTGGDKFEQQTKMKLGDEGNLGAESMPSALPCQRGTAIAEGDKLEQQLKMKLGEDDKISAESIPTAALPRQRTETITAGDKFEQRLKMKLQEGGNISTESMPVAALPRQRAPAITARDKVEQQTKIKLEEDGNIGAGSIPAAALPHQRAETTTSGNTFEQRLKMKLREDGDSRPKSMPAAALPRHRAMATTGGDKFEQQTKMKLGDEGRAMATTGGDKFEQQTKVMLGDEGNIGAESMPSALPCQRGTAIAEGDKLEQQLKMKSGEDDKISAESIPTAALPRQRTETITAGNKFEQRLKMKLQEGGNISTDSMPSAALSRQRAPAITARDKVEQQTKMKLEEDGNIDAGSIPAAALPRQRAETTTSGNTFEQRLKMKLREDTDSIEGGPANVAPPEMQGEVVVNPVAQSMPTSSPPSIGTAAAAQKENARDQMLLPTNSSEGGPANVVPPEIQGEVVVNPVAQSMLTSSPPSIGTAAAAQEENARDQMLLPTDSIEGGPANVAPPEIQGEVVISPVAQSMPTSSPPSIGMAAAAQEENARDQMLLPTNSSEGGPANLGPPEIQGEVAVKPVAQSKSTSSPPSVLNQALSKDPSIPILEARLVEEQPEVPIYDAVEVQVVGPPPFWKRRRFIFSGMSIIIVGMGSVLGTVLGRSSDNEPTVFIMISSEPSQSSAPTQGPTLRPSSRPSQSAAPSLVRSFYPSFQPSFRPTSSSPPSSFWSSFKWKQQGQAILGETTEDWTGESVDLSADGMILAIGSPGKQRNNRWKGFVKVYYREYDGSSWKRLGHFNGAADGDHFGESVALSEDGKTLAIGAPGHWRNPDRPGYVRVYNREDDPAVTNWKQLGQDIVGEAIGDQSGICVSLSADGKTLAIGANINNGNGTSAGHVRVHHLENDGSNWKQLGQDIDGEAPHDRSGFSISLSADGKILAIGASANDSNGNMAGHARVYRMEASGPRWEQLGHDIDGEAAGDRSGYSLSLSGNGETLAIGAYGNSGNGYGTGHVRVYFMEGDGNGLSWKQLGQDIDGEAAGDNFGQSVSLSADGKMLAVAAKDNFGGRHGGGSGYVKVYHMDDNGLNSSWKQIGQDIDGEAVNDQPVWSVALSLDGKTVAIGSHWNSEGSDGEPEKKGSVSVHSIAN